MASRFMERINRQSETLKQLFGEPQFDPPPYPASEDSRPTSISSSQYEASRSSAPPGYRQHAERTVRASNNQQWSIPLDSLILVTGADSWLGTHIVDQLLSYGYRVRGTVRSGEKAIRTSKFFEQSHGLGRYHAAQVPDMATKAAFDDVTRDCVGVVHVASVTTLSPDPHEVITPSIAGAINALEAATKAGSVKRFVYCSSIAAALSPNRSTKSETTSESWNMLDFDEAWAPPPYDPGRIAAVQASAKMQTEAAIWRWYGRTRPDYVLNAVLPGNLFGGVLDLPPDLPCTISFPSTINDSYTVARPPAHAVDVEDTALLHVAALLLPDVKDQRIFAASAQDKVQSPALLQPAQAYFPSQRPVSLARSAEKDHSILVDAEKAGRLLQRMGRRGWRDREGNTVQVASVVESLDTMDSVST